MYINILVNIKPYSFFHVNWKASVWWLWLKDISYREHVYLFSVRVEGSTLRKTSSGHCKQINKTASLVHSIRNQIELTRTSVIYLLHNAITFDSTHSNCGRVNIVNKEVSQILFRPLTRKDVQQSASLKWAWFWPCIKLMYQHNIQRMNALNALN